MSLNYGLIMNKAYVVFIFVIFHIYTLSIFAIDENLKNFNENLQKEFLEMGEKEQELRQQWLDAKDSKEEEELKQKVIEIDDLHLIRLKEVVEEYGWPGHSLVGPQGSHAFWLLVQHTPDELFQSKCLELLEQAVSDQNASPIDLAYLKDRVYMYSGKKQIYGTQLNGDLTFYPIEDEEHVNERRSAIGLPSIEEYFEVIKEIYGHRHRPSSD